MKGLLIADRPILRRLAAVLLLVLWTGLILYPNPVPLVVSFQRTFHPPVDATAVRTIADSLPDDPAAVEAFSEKYLTYRTAWEEYNQFWYFPDVKDILERRAGDCQAEALLTASILTAKGIPFTWRYSVTHAWVEYQGKAANYLEDPATAVASDSGEGWLSGLPAQFPVREVFDQLAAYYWTPMPEYRKFLLLVGLLLALVLGEWPVFRRGAIVLRNLTSPKAGDKI